MKKVMAVVTAETIFAERFTEYMNGSGMSMLRAKPFPSMEEFLSYREEHGKESVPVLLCDKLLFAKKRGSDFTGTIVLLLAETEREGVLNKYQSGPALLRDVLNKCADQGLCVEASAARQKLQIYTVWGTEHSAGRLFFSLALCRMLSRRKKTIYMDLCSFSGLRAYTGKSYEKGLSTAVYYLRQDKLDGQRLMGLIENCEGISYLPPAASSEDTEMMSAEDRNRIFETFADETPVECVVADIPDSLAAQMEILEMSDRVFLVSACEPVARESMELFREMLKNDGRNDLLEKLVEASLPAEFEKYRPKEGIDNVIFSETGDRIRRTLAL